MCVYRYLCISIQIYMLGMYFAYMKKIYKCIYEYIYACVCICLLCIWNVFIYICYLGMLLYMYLSFFL